MERMTAYNTIVIVNEQNDIQETVAVDNILLILTLSDDNQLSQCTAKKNNLDSIQCRIIVGQHTSVCNPIPAAKLLGYDATLKAR
jgi:hypothetical protein